MIIVKGPKSACSKVDNVEGLAATTNLRQHQSADGLFVQPRISYLISAEMLSKMYWSKSGLLGFFEIAPKMFTSLCK